MLEYMNKDIHRREIVLFNDAIIKGETRIKEHNTHTRCTCVPLEPSCLHLIPIDTDEDSLLWSVSYG